MTQETLEEQYRGSFFSGGNAEYVEGLYEDYLHDPNSVPDEWKTCFEALKASGQAPADVSHQDLVESLKTWARQPQLAGYTQDPQAIEQVKQQARVMQLIHAYRCYGHHHATLDPLSLRERERLPALDYKTHGLEEADLDKRFNAETLTDEAHPTLLEILTRLKRTYCGHVGVEYRHITDNEETRWIQTRMESIQSTPHYSKEEQHTLYEKVLQAELLEKYLGRKYVGQKRFSVEGAEALIPSLWELVERSAAQSVQSVVIGMAHRGRLNVLVNILGKATGELFDAFEGKYHESAISGDVKYHLGFSSNVCAEAGDIHVSLAFNPSHLEIIDPVVEGSVRSRQERLLDEDKSKVVPILIHGDAAFAGQGVVMETFNMSQARGFSTGGTVHLIVNNQVGFTTSNPLDARSTLYCTDVAKMVQAPVFHVNGDDPEAVLWVTQMALDYRMRFKKDVVIDIVCYRRHGHNEADEPSGTQPLMYAKIKKHPTLAALYRKQLLEKGRMTPEEAKALEAAYTAKLQAGESVVNMSTAPNQPSGVDWTPYHGRSWREYAATNLPEEALQAAADALFDIPEGFVLQKQVEKEWAGRKKMLTGDVPINWGFAELLAYATLVKAGYSLRLSGEDSGRGTFAHRHAVLHDYQTGEVFSPLTALAKTEGKVTAKVIDSILSEEAVLGFEYGYAAADPDSLVIWEAQFGDFANGAQVVIDQFISSAEQKWNRLCGLVLLLPHGYEGQGPEHSSARLERFLQLCAQENMQVCVPTTPAQVFHMLRRQMLRAYRKPLIVMTPKSILRHKKAVSTVSELTCGAFQLLIRDSLIPPGPAIERLILCSGKVYYDLLEKREETGLANVALIRIEQQYPFPTEEVTEVLAAYPKAREIVWCQEEPKNQGAWYFIRPQLEACLQKHQTLYYAGRSHSASPAAGSVYLHKAEQIALVCEALGIDPPSAG